MRFCSPTNRSHLGISNETNLVLSLLYSKSNYFPKTIVVVCMLGYLVDDRSLGDVCLVFSLHSMRHEKGHISISTFASIHCSKEEEEERGGGGKTPSALSLSLAQINLMMTFDRMEWKQKKMCNCLAWAIETRILCEDLIQSSINISLGEGKTTNFERDLFSWKKTCLINFSFFSFRLSRQLNVTFNQRERERKKKKRWSSSRINN